MEKLSSGAVVSRHGDGVVMLPNQKQQLFHNSRFQTIIWGNDIEIIQQWWLPASDDALITPRFWRNYNKMGDIHQRERYDKSSI